MIGFGRPNRKYFKGSLSQLWQEKCLDINPAPIEGPLISFASKGVPPSSFETGIPIIIGKITSQITLIRYEDNEHKNYQVMRRKHDKRREIEKIFHVYSY